MALEKCLNPQVDLNLLKCNYIPIAAKLVSLILLMESIWVLKHLKALNIDRKDADPDDGTIRDGM